LIYYLTVGRETQPNLGWGIRYIDWLEGGTAGKLDSMIMELQNHSKKRQLPDYNLTLEACSWWQQQQQHVQGCITQPWSGLFAEQQEAEHGYASGLHQEMAAQSVKGIDVKRWTLTSSSNMPNLRGSGCEAYEADCWYVTLRDAR
jgi:hypothetical protein